MTTEARIPEADVQISVLQLPLTDWKVPGEADQTVVELSYLHPGSYNTVTLDEAPEDAGHLTGVAVYWLDLQGVWHPAHMLGQQDCLKLPARKNFYFRRVTAEALRICLRGRDIRLERLFALESREQDVPRETGLLELEPNIRPNAAQKKMTRDGYTMFLHFGLNTFTDSEWSYGELSPSVFAPTAIDAEQWVRTAWEAGMNSVLLITKHHDGFCLWDSRFTDYSVAHPDSGCHLDIVQQVSDACNKYGVNLGIYYSAWDNTWDRRSGKEDDAGYCAYMRNQIGELLSGRYGLKDAQGRGRISELWIDGNWEKAADRWEFDRLYDHVKRLQPDCQIGLNWTVGEDIHRPVPIRQQKEGDRIHYWCSDFRLGDGDETGEQDVKLFSYQGQTYYLPFEATLCLNSADNWKPSWFWHPGYGQAPLSPEIIAEKYRKYQSQDNVLVLNSPPNRDGRLEQADIAVLYEAARRLGIARGGAAEK